MAKDPIRLVVTGALAREILRLSKKDAKLLAALADDWIARIDSTALNAYLLDANTTRELLTRRFRRDPAGTLGDLNALAQKERTRSARPASKRRRSRHRLTAVEITRLKEGVLTFLQANGWSTRKEITEAAGIPTPSLYTRVITELREGGVIRARGEKAKTSYALSPPPKPRKRKRPAKR